MSDVTFDMSNNKMQVHAGQRRAVAGHAARHRRRDDDRRPAQARAPVPRRRRLLLHLRRRRQRRRHQRHRSPSIATHGKLLTVTAVQPPGPLRRPAFVDGRHQPRFEEKPRGDGAWVNGGFFVASPARARLHRRRRHRLGAGADGAAGAPTGSSPPTSTDGFWHPMDTLRDKEHLEELWNTGQAAVENWDTPMGGNR